MTCYAVKYYLFFLEILVTIIFRKNKHLQSLKLSKGTEWRTWGNNGNLIAAEYCCLRNAPRETKGNFFAINQKPF